MPRAVRLRTKVVGVADSAVVNRRLYSRVNVLWSEPVVATCRSHWRRRWLFGLTFGHLGGKPHVNAPNVRFSDLRNPEDRQRVVVYIAETTERMITALRPRLEAATPMLP